MIAEYADANRSREESSCMLADATTGEAPFDYSAVHKMDRFPRSLEESVLCRDRLSTSGVRIVVKGVDKTYQWGCRRSAKMSAPVVREKCHRGRLAAGWAGE